MTTDHVSREDRSGETIAQVPRKVRFFAFSQTLSADELTDRIGLAADEVEGPRWTPDGRHFFDYSSWQIKDFGTGADDLSAIIERTMTRVAQVFGNLLALRTDSDTTFILRIVQYVGDDPVGPGFCLEPWVVSMISALGASIDVDEYHCGPDDGS